MVKQSQFYPESAAIRKEAAAKRKAISSGWTMDEVESILLDEAMSYYKQEKAAAKVVEKEGLVLADKSGRQYLHPAAVWQKVCANNFQRLLKAIGFDRALRDKRKRQPGRPTDLELWRDKNAREEDDLGLE